MDHHNRAALAEAANTLVTDVDAKTLYAQMQGVLEVAAKNIPVQLVGRASVLNPLIALAIGDEAAFRRVMDLVDRKRREAGLDALSEMDIDRRAYMREFMAVRRERLRRLVDLWNQLRSENDKIRGASRLQFEQLHGARWIDEKNRREDALRAKLGRRLTMDERRQVGDSLWADVEEELAALEDFVRQEIRKPLHARSKSGFQFQVGAMPKKG